MYHGFMDALVWMMKLVHNTVGITTPEPKYERPVAVLWVFAIFGLVAMTMLLGYFFISNIAASR